MTGLTQKTCKPCKGETAALKGAALAGLAAQLGEGWQIVGEHHLEKAFLFADFKSALGFTNKVGALAEQENHHPDFTLGWGRVGLTIYTHAVDGLTENDFILAAKIDAIA